MRCGKPAARQSHGAGIPLLTPLLPSYAELGATARAAGWPCLPYGWPCPLLEGR